MTYKETLFFIGKCLTINHEEHNKNLVEKELVKGEIDWDKVVKVSTGHYVFPALYLNLKKADFLGHLPQDLVSYMKHITDLNRERNEQIIAQANEINTLLRNHDISPIFLKGSGNLLEGLYEDIAERMVGDIDFLVNPELANKAYEILINNGYTPLKEGTYIIHRHLKRLRSEVKIAAVEVHVKMISGKMDNEFNYDFITKKLSKDSFLAYKDQLCLSILANQINDYGARHFYLNLKNCYDTYLIALKTNTLEAIKRLPSGFIIMNNFLAVNSNIMNSKQIEYLPLEQTNSFLKTYIYYTENPIKHQRKIKYEKAKVFLKSRMKIIGRAFFKKEYTKFVFELISSKDWQERKLIQFGLKKPKPNA